MKKLPHATAALMLLCSAFPAAAETGTLSNDCAPWDGSAVSISLDNHITAAIYVPITAVLDLREAATYTADTDQSPGKAAITACDSDGLNCEQKTGTITLNPPGSGDVSGSVEWQEGDMITRQEFHVKLIQKQVFCG